MKYEKFEQLNETEAQRLLTDFRTDEASKIEALVLQSGITESAFTIDSLLPFLAWVLRQMKITTVPADASVPVWIRETRDYQRGLFEFDESSRFLIVSAAYYVGETFVQSFDSLDWAVGDQETALCNMPVVQGFMDKGELPPLLVLENIFKRIISSPERTGDIERMVNRWIKRVN